MWKFIWVSFCLPADISFPEAPGHLEYRWNESRRAGETVQEFYHATAMSKDEGTGYSGKWKLEHGRKGLPGQGSGK